MHFIQKTLPLGSRRDVLADNSPRKRQMPGIAPRHFVVNHWRKALLGARFGNLSYYLLLEITTPAAAIAIGISARAMPVSAGGGDSGSVVASGPVVAAGAEVSPEVNFTS